MPHPRACAGVCVCAGLPRTEPPGTGHLLGGEHIGRGEGVTPAKTHSQGRQAPRPRLLVLPGRGWRKEQSPSP